MWFYQAHRLIAIISYDEITSIWQKTQKLWFSPKYLHNVRFLGSNVGNFRKGWLISSCMMKLIQYWQLLSCWENISLSMMKLHEYSKLSSVCVQVIVRAIGTSSWPKMFFKILLNELGENFIQNILASMSLINQFCRMIDPTQWLTN